MVIVLKDNLQKNINPLKGSIKPNWEGFLIFDFFDSDILYYAQSDIFDKSKVLLKPLVLVVFYSPINCRRQYHCVAISLAKQIPLAKRRIRTSRNTYAIKIASISENLDVFTLKLPSVLKNTRQTEAFFFKQRTIICRTSEVCSLQPQKGGKPNEHIFCA